MCVLLVVGQQSSQGLNFTSMRGFWEFIYMSRTSFASLHHVVRVALTLTMGKPLCSPSPGGVHMAPGGRQRAHIDWRPMVYFL